MFRLISISFLLFVACHILNANSAYGQTLRYTILSNGRVAGSEVSVYSPGGHVNCTFEYNDRGRGPKISANYLVGPDGLPLSLDETGNDYLKVQVDEHFSVENHRPLEEHF